MDAHKLIMESKAGSVLTFTRQGNEKSATFEARVQAGRHAARRHGVVTIFERVSGSELKFTLLNDMSNPATKAELAALQKKQNPTLIEWANKRKKIAPAGEAVTPLVERLEPQDPNRAAGRMHRIEHRDESRHAMVADAVKTNGNGAHIQAERMPPLSPAHGTENEERKLWAEAFVTCLQTNPMGSFESRRDAAAQAVNAFRDFFR